jgi:hypothetical protein
MRDQPEQMQRVRLVRLPREDVTIYPLGLRELSRLVQSNGAVNLGLNLLRPVHAR